MNVFFTCKNTLVILLQLYRLYVVHSEHNKKKSADEELTHVSIISKGDFGETRRNKSKKTREKDLPGAARCSKREDSVTSRSKR